MSETKCNIIQKLVKTIVESCLKLSKDHNIPFLLAYQTFGSLQTIGTKNVKEELLTVINEHGKAELFK